MRTNKNKGLWALAAAVLAAVSWYMNKGAPATADARQPTPVRTENAAPQQRAQTDQTREAFEAKSRGRMISASGVVERTLADDRDGSPHQRFIIRTASGLTVLVAHNLDLAPRLDGLRAGDSVELRGEYEWNERGGVLHWTHDDPRGSHEAGYIDWNGKRYQ